MSASASANGVRTVGAADDPPVLLLHPWWGVTPAMDEWAQDLAGAGRRVVVPDLYGGRTASTIEEADALAQAALEDDATFRFVERCADELAGQGRPWAAMGFSLGAFLACHLAGRGSSGPDELVLMYGGQPPQGEISRTRRAGMHVVPDDEYFTAEEIAAVQDAFRAAGTQLDIYLYPASGHWFAERGSPAFDEPAFEQARARVLAQLSTKP
jgi:carboxymethylenebutenolidase